MSLVSFIGPKPNLLDIDEMNPPLRLEVEQPVLDFDEMAKIRHIERYTTASSGASSSTSPTRSAWGNEGDRGAPRLAVRAGRGRRARRLQHPDRLRPQGRTASSVAIPALLALSAIHQHLVEQGPAHRDRPGGRDRLGARGAPLRAARRLRRRGGPSVPRAGDAARPRRTASCRRDVDGREGDQELHQGDRQGPAEGDVQDGHLDLHVLLRRADLRGRRPVASAGRQVFHRHRLQRRGHRRVRGRRGSAAHAPRGLRRRPGARRRARRRRRVRLPRARRGAHVDAGRDRQAAARDAREQLRRPTRNTPQLINDQSRAAHDACAGCSSSRSTACKADAARRGRAGRGDRQALRHRRDVARLDLDRGAHHARRSR